MKTFSQEWKDFGQTLKKARQDRGMSIKELSKKIKVNSVLLKAMEEGKRESLPPYVFLRGYMFSYTQALGLKNRLEILQQLKELSYKEKRFKQESYAEGKVVNDLVEKTSYSGPVILVSVALLALGVVLFFSNWNYTYNKQKENSLARKGASVSIESAIPKSKDYTKREKKDKIILNQNLGKKKPKVSNQKLAKWKNFSIIPVDKKREVEIMVRAKKNLMFSYQIDNGHKENLFLKKNQFKILKGMKKIWLKTDVLDGLHLFQNGVDIGFLASSNDKEKIFLK